MTVSEIVERCSDPRDRKFAESSSFRDPAGHVFRSEDGTLLRQVNSCYEHDYRHLMDSGLYESLVTDGCLIQHVEAHGDSSDVNVFKILRPELVPFISYPYEWSFGQLKDAALLTLEVQRRALEHGMWLKDATSFNIQFVGSRAVFIDTLSFERYRDGEPWVAYGQFCRHFLAPLALMSTIDSRCLQMLRTNIDGIPLDLAAKLIPAVKRLNPGMFLHLSLHAKSVTRHSDTSHTSSNRNTRMSRVAIEGLIDSLRRCIEKLRMADKRTEWSDYYANNSYTGEASDRKSRIVRGFMSNLQPKFVWDLGANTGVYSRLASEAGAYTVAFDIDQACVEANYQRAKNDRSTNLMPLVMDISNPSPGLGWAHCERSSLAERGSADIVMALALLHHLAIGNQIPFAHIASYLAKLGKYLIIEFVPSGDPQAQRLLRGRRGPFHDYSLPGFEESFDKHFEVVSKQDLDHDGRTIFLLKRRFMIREKLSRTR